MLIWVYSSNSHILPNKSKQSKQRQVVFQQIAPFAAVMLSHEFHITAESKVYCFAEIALFCGNIIKYVVNERVALNATSLSIKVLLPLKVVSGDARFPPNS